MKLTNDDAFLFGILLNHLIVFALFFHWLSFPFSTNALLILSRIDLLILPISDLEGLNHLVQSSIFQECKTNNGKIFLQLLSKHFSKNQKMHNVFNRNTVKISYSCMKNVDSIISAHNQNILNPIVQSYGCNCQVKSN